MYSGRERKTKSTKAKGSRGAAAAAAAEQEGQEKKKKGSKRDKYLKTTVDPEDSDEAPQQGARLGPASQRRGMGAVNLYSLAENVFMQWEELLGSREGLKRRIETISAVHGREGRRILTGGIQPSSLLESIRTELTALGPASEALERADLLLELEEKRAKLEALALEKNALVDDICMLREDCFEAKDQLAGQSEELETLRQALLEWEMQHGAKTKRGDSTKNGSSGGKAGGGAISGASLSDSSAVVDLSVFKQELSRAQMAEGKRVVQALERLKLPIESSMSPRELACWHENKKTIMNSLKTLSGQIYSATTRIIYELIQNSDDCSFNDDGELRELYLECNENALVSFHNERGFQPRDLYGKFYAFCNSAATF
jgi:hypothetical protein